MTSDGNGEILLMDFFYRTFHFAPLYHFFPFELLSMAKCYKPNDDFYTLHIYIYAWVVIGTYTNKIKRTGSSTFDETKLSNFPPIFFDRYKLAANSAYGLRPKII